MKCSKKHFTHRERYFHPLSQSVAGRILNFYLYLQLVKEKCLKLMRLMASYQLCGTLFDLLSSLLLRSLTIMDQLCMISKMILRTTFNFMVKQRNLSSKSRNLFRNKNNRKNTKKKKNKRRLRDSLELLKKWLVLLLKIVYLKLLPKQKRSLEK